MKKFVISDAMSDRVCAVVVRWSKAPESDRVYLHMIQAKRLDNFVKANGSPAWVCEAIVGRFIEATWN